MTHSITGTTPTARTDSWKSIWRSQGVEPTTRTKDAYLIEQCEREGTVIYSWQFPTSHRTLYQLPDGSGVEITEEWGGAHAGQPRRRVYVSGTRTKPETEMERIDQEIHRVFDSLCGDALTVAHNELLTERAQWEALQPAL